MLNIYKPYTTNKGFSLRLIQGNYTNYMVEYTDHNGEFVKREVVEYKRYSFKYCFYVDGKPNHLVSALCDYYSMYSLEIAVELYFLSHDLSGDELATHAYEKSAMIYSISNAPQTSEIEKTYDTECDCEYRCSCDDDDQDNENDADHEQDARPMFYSDDFYEKMEERLRHGQDIADETRYREELFETGFYRDEDGELHYIDERVAEYLFREIHDDDEE